MCYDVWKVISRSEIFEIRILEGGAEFKNLEKNGAQISLLMRSRSESITCLFKRNFEKKIEKMVKIGKCVAIQQRVHKVGKLVFPNAVGIGKGDRKEHFEKIKSIDAYEVEV